MSLDTIHPKARRFTMFLALVYATLGVPTLSQPGCDRMQVQDPVTGVYRDATPAEKTKLIEDTGAAATAVVETIPGGIAVVPIIQALTQLGALFVAWRIRPSDAAAAARDSAAVAAATPPATPPASTS